MSAPPPDLTPMALIVTALTAAIGPQLAASAAAYTLILFGWSAGAIVGLWRLPPGDKPRLRMLAFVAASLVITLGATVSIAQMTVGALHPAMPWVEDPRSLIFPLAVLLPAIGHSWLDVAAWLWLVIKRRLPGANSPERNP